MTEDTISMIQNCFLGVLLASGISAIYFLIMIAICSIDKFNPIYCFIFQRKDWKLWRRVCKELPYARLFDHYYSKNYEHLENYKLFIYDIGIGKPVQVIYWVADGIASVSDMDGNCILSDFDEYHSNKAVEIIRKYLPL